MTEQQAISRDELISTIGNGTTLITGNSRLASSILAEYEHKMRLQDMEAWQTPDVLSVKAWLFRSWEEVALAGQPESPMQLLTSDQESHLWELILGQHSQALLRTQATAKGAQKARQLMQDWCLQRKKSDFSLNEDTLAFAEWADKFEHLCDENYWLTESGIPGQLIKLVRAKSWLPGNELIWTGFDELTPALAFLTECLSGAGVTVRHVEIRENAGRLVRFAATDTRSEIEKVCCWVRGRLEENSDARIGVVVPDLAVVRTVLTDTMARVLVPAQMLPDSENISLPWNISLGQPLAGYALIRLAIQILGLAGNESTVEEVGSILRSPWIAGAEQEAAVHSRLEVKLRQRGEPCVTLSTLHYLARRDTEAVDKDNSIEYAGAVTVSELLQRIAGLKALQKTCPKQASANEWVVWFGKWLNGAGWASGRTLSSHEYQIAEAWKKLLIDFGTLDAIAGRFSFVTALARIKNMASSRIFQPQSSDAPVQILGLYEAIGLRFDHLWVMGLHDNAWPPSPRPDPFIPLALQLRHNMPHTTQARELMVARAITERLSRSAAEIVFSYPKQSAEEQLRPASLITGFPEVQEQGLELWKGQSWRVRVRESRMLEQGRVDDVPPLPLQLQQASGGSAIFKYQSLCPFRAFAELRLGARSMDSIHSGLDAMQRGKLLHSVLELFWQDVKDQKHLLDMSQGQLDEMVREKVVIAIETNISQFPQLHHNRFREVETDRLSQLTLQWLAIEKNRSSFTVSSFEKKIDTVVNGVGVNLWIDRIDKLDDGRKVIIDYKTGKVSPGDWFGERPNDPQLPLYSVVEGGDIAAVVFGQIRPGDLAFKGVVQNSDLIPDLPSKSRQLKDATQQWPAVLDEWKQEIERLAKEFSNGDASVNPKNGSVTCVSSYCQLAALCRINEQQDLSDDEQGDGHE